MSSEARESRSNTITTTPECHDVTSTKMCIGALKVGDLITVYTVKAFRGVHEIDIRVQYDPVTRPLPNGKVLQYVRGRISILDHPIDVVLGQTDNPSQGRMSII